MCHLVCGGVCVNINASVPPAMWTSGARIPFLHSRRARNPVSPPARGFFSSRDRHPDQSSAVGSHPAYSIHNSQYTEIQYGDTSQSRGPAG